MSSATPSEPTRAAPPSRAAVRSALVALFAVYLVLLVWAVLWKLQLPWVGSGDLRAVKLVPFVASEGFGAGSRTEQIANVALFVPFGVYLGLLAPAWRWWRIVATAAAFSAGLEAAQYVLAVGSTDVTDVILNTTGALIGVAVLAGARRAFGRGAAHVVAWGCAALTVVAVVASAAFASSAVRFGPPEAHRDGISRPQR